MKARKLVLLASAFALALAVPAAYAQGHAKPRGPGEGSRRGTSAGIASGDKQKHRDGDRSRDRQPHARPAPERQHPQPRAEAPPREERRRHDGDRRGYAVPRDPDGRDDARDRHPRPDPDRHWQDHRFGHRDYQGIWGHDRYDHRDHYWFPRSYRTHWGYRWRYHGLLFGRHARFWCPEFRLYFYWPFEDEPEYGCGWYWVPSYRTLEWTPYGYRYRYWGWEHVWLCFD